MGARRVSEGVLIETDLLVGFLRGTDETVGVILQRVPAYATVVQAIESRGIRDEVGTAGAGAGVGAIVGGLLGGVKGAVAGLLIGGGGTLAATTGKDVKVQPGTVLRVRFDSPLVVR